jgi:hypothetical protein
LDEPLPPKTPFEDSRPSPEEMETKWRNAMDAVMEAPRSPEALLHAAALAEQMGRKGEAFTYYHKAILLDPGKAFLLPKLRQNAATPEQQQEATKLARRPTTFGRALDDVLVYPFRGGGIAILIVGAVFVFGARLLFKYNVFLPGLSVVAGAILGAYLSMFYVDVCNSTSTGSEDLPEWPDPVRFREFLLDWAKLFTAYLAAFLPIVGAVVALGIVVAQQVPPPEPALPAAYSSYYSDAELFIRRVPAAKEVPPPVTRPSPTLAERLPAGVKNSLAIVLAGAGVCFALGLVYLPMATLANCVYGHPFACLNPVFVFRSMFAAPKNYAVCVLAYFGTGILVILLEGVASFSGLFLFSGAVVCLIELYGMTVQMRILGIFYRMNQSKLRWMSD